MGWECDEPSEEVCLVDPSTHRPLSGPTWGAFMNAEIWVPHQEVLLYLI